MPPSFDPNDNAPISRQDYAALVSLTKTLLKRVGQLGRWKRLGPEVATYKAQLEEITDHVRDNFARTPVQQQIEDVQGALMLFRHRHSTPHKESTDESTRDSRSS